MRRTLTVLFCAGAVLLLAADRSPGDAAYQRANALFVAKKFPECEAALEEALRLDAKLVPALTLAAKLAMTVNRFDVAREDLRRALDADPRSAYAQFLYGLQFYLNNDLGSALPELEKARRLNPSDPRAALYLGLTEESLGKTAPAMSLYEEAVRLEKAAGAPDPDTFLVGARLLLLSGRTGQSELWVDRALALAPASRDAHFEKARLLLQQNHPADAALQAETALRLPGGSASDAQIHYLLVRAYRASGQPDRAAPHADALRSTGPSRP